MKKILKNSWVLGIGTTVVGGVIVSLIVDAIQGINVLSTLKNVLLCIGNSILYFLNIRLKIWWILIAILIIVLALFLYAKYLDNKDKSDTTEFLKYTRDTLFDHTWEWSYERDWYGQYSISNLHPVCAQCGMNLRDEMSFGRQMKCVRCNKLYWFNQSDYNDTILMIEDNIKKKCYMGKK